MGTRHAGFDTALRAHVAANYSGLEVRYAGDLHGAPPDAGHLLITDRVSTVVPLGGRTAGNQDDGFIEVKIFVPADAKAGAGGQVQTQMDLVETAFEGDNAIIGTTFVTLGVEWSSQFRDPAIARETIVGRFSYYRHTAAA